MERHSYATDLSDDEWALIEPLLPLAKGGRTGRPRKYPKREMLNAMLYLLRTGCQWRNLPNDMPPYTAVWEQFWRWRNDGTLDKIHAALRTKAREKSGRAAAPGAAILDSQSVKTTEKGARKDLTPTRR